MAAPPCFPPLTSASTFTTPNSDSLSLVPSDVSGLLYAGFRGLATRWTSSQQEVNYTGHNGLSLLLWRPPLP